MKDANIVFVNYFHKDDILAAVRSVVSDIAESPYDVQVTVADNSENQDDICEAIHDEFSAVRYIDCGGNVGFGKGNTLGFKATPARYYFALNRDTLIPAGTRAIERMIRFMDERPRIGCIGPKLLNPDGTVQDSCYRFDLTSILIKPLRHIAWDKEYRWVRRLTDTLLMKDFDREKTQPVDWVLGAAMMVRHQVAEQVGWFDERYFLYMEDADWCRTMWAHGWPVYYVHDIEIIHRYARESAKIPGLRALFKNPLSRVHARSWLKFLWKWRTHFSRYAP